MVAVEISLSDTTRQLAPPSASPAGLDQNTSVWTGHFEVLTSRADTHLHGCAQRIPFGVLVVLSSLGCTTSQTGPCGRRCWCEDCVHWRSISFGFAERTALFECECSTGIFVEECGSEQKQMQTREQTSVKSIDMSAQMYFEGRSVLTFVLTGRLNFVCNGRPPSLCVNALHCGARTSDQL